MNNNIEHYERRLGEIGSLLAGVRDSIQVRLPGIEHGIAALEREVKESAAASPEGKVILAKLSEYKKEVAQFKN